MQVTKIASLAIALSFLTVGCSTPSSSSTASPEFPTPGVPESGTIVQVPDRHSSFWTETKMHPCYIVKTNSATADSVIKVYVGGEVAHAGAIEVPEGTTVLEAVVAAGGFTHFAAAYELRLLMNGKRYAPELHRRKSRNRKVDEAWCGDGEGDVVLEPEANISVPRH